MRASPGANCLLPLPSKDAQAYPLLWKGTWTRSVTYSGKINGLKDNECGQIGVKSIPGTCILEYHIKQGFEKYGTIISKSIRSFFFSEPLSENDFEYISSYLVSQKDMMAESTNVAMI